MITNQSSATTAEAGILHPKAAATESQRALLLDLHLTASLGEPEFGTNGHHRGQRNPGGFAGAF
jgi:hypothetical protein